MRMNRSFILIAALSLPLAASPAFANLLTNGGFETGDFTGWTPSIDNFVLVAQADTRNGFPPTARENGFYVFDGLWAAQLGPIGPETLSQQFSVVAGDTYALTYWLNGDPLSTTNLFATSFGEAPPTIELDNTTYWTEEFDAFTATTTGLDTLNFTFDDADGNFMALDDVDVEDLSVQPIGVGTTGTSVTPEPSSLLLLGTGICGIAAMARRKLLNA
jgi:PEP-CTERM motif